MTGAPTPWPAGAFARTPRRASTREGWVDRPAISHWPRRNGWFLLVLLVVCAGCADTVGIATQQDLAQLREEVSQLRQDLSALTLSVQRTRNEAETRLVQVERESRDQQAETQRQVAPIQSRIEGLTADLTRLAGRLEDLSHEMEKLRRQPQAAPSPSPPPVTSPGPAPPQQPGGPQPGDTYQAAYLDFSKGNYSLAIEGFREFVRRFPDADHADDAQYWIGEAYFSLASMAGSQGAAEKVEPALEQAVQEFRKVIVNYPRGDRVPAALYKEALALLALKRQSLARSRLEYLLDHFPRSEEAPLARERLAALKESQERWSEDEARRGELNRR